MLPSSSSQLARYGQINHYKKFWLLQTQLEKQEQTSTALCLGVTGNANAKESKPIISSNALIANGDHLINNNNNTAGHGSCRGDMVTSSASSSRAGAFPYCSNEPGSLKFYTNNLGYIHSSSNGSLRDSPALSLAVNCESAAHPITFFNQTWAPSSFCPASELQLRNLPNLASTHTCIPGQVKYGAEECDSSECSKGRGEKRGLVSDNAATSPSTSSVSLSSKLAGDLHSNHPSSTFPPNSLEEVAVLPSSSRSGPGFIGPLRICTLCGTTKTPLWRSGPDGPKSLCNACGIRVKKTKRLQAAMEAAGGGAEEIISGASSPAGAYKRLLAATTKAAGRAGTTHKRKLSMEAAENQTDPIFQLKKKKKAAGSRRSSCCSWPPPNVAEMDSGTCYRVFGDASANFGAVVDSTSSKRVSNLFAKDVEEAAVLLMALSCGLVLS